MVSARRFREAFLGQWNEDLEDRQQEIVNAYPHAPLWTKWMLTEDDAFLRRLVTRLQRDVRIGWYHLDAIYFDPTNNPVPGLGEGFGHPARLEVYIEHENGNNPEEEMYKLTMWPASLKVLIFYDWPAYDHNPNHRQWLTQELTTMFQMGREIDVQRPGVSKAEYLFLIGRTEQEGVHIPTWRYLVAQDGCWPEQPGEPRVLGP